MLLHICEHLCLHGDVDNHYRLEVKLAIKFIFFWHPFGLHNDIALVENYVQKKIATKIG